MGKKKNYKKYIFSGATNPFNLVNVKNNKRAISFAKQKDIIKMNRVLKSNVYIDERETPFGDRVTERYYKEAQGKGKKRVFNLNEEEHLPTRFAPLQDADGSDDTLKSNKRQKLKNKVEKDIYKSALKSVDDDWKKIRYLETNNKSVPVCAPETKDSYDTAKAELLFEKKSVASASSQSSSDVAPLKVLFNINDFNLDIVLKKADDIEFMNDICQDLHFMATKNNLETAHALLEILDGEYEIFSFFKKQNTARNNPRCQTVGLLRIISLIYSTSAVRHPVVTPAMIFMSDVLGSEFHYSYGNILTRLLVCEIAINCLSETKRYIPEAFYFLGNILELALPNETKKKKTATSHKRFDLIISEKVSCDEIPELQLYPKDKTVTTEGKKVGIISIIASQVLSFASMYKDYPLFKIIFEPLQTIFSQLPVHLYPIKLEALIKKVIEFLGKETPPLIPLSFQKPKPKDLKFLEPSFKCKYESLEKLERRMNGCTSNTQVKNNAIEQQKRLKNVKRKIRQEERSLLKEIRKVSKADAALKYERKKELDAERKSKTAKIYAELSVQEGEFKKIMKRK